MYGCCNQLHAVHNSRSRVKGGWGNTVEPIGSIGGVMASDRIAADPQSSIAGRKQGRDRSICDIKCGSTDCEQGIRWNIRDTEHGFSSRKSSGNRCYPIHTGNTGRGSNSFDFKVPKPNRDTKVWMAGSTATHVLASWGTGIRSGLLDARGGGPVRERCLHPDMSRNEGA